MTQRAQGGRRPPRAVVSVAAALVLLVAGPVVLTSAAGDPRRGLPAVGVQFHAIWSDYTDAGREEVLDRLQEAGVEWVRVDFSWAMLQPDGRSTWSDDALARLGSVLEMADRRGMEVLLMFWLTPAWANGGAGERSAPDDPQDYARALAELVTRFGDRVAAWEVWNEPNDPTFLTGADPRTYAELLGAAFRAVEDRAPRELVVFGGLAYNDAEWLARAYAAGAGGHFDVLAVHPYPGVSDLPPDAPDDGTKWRLTHVTRVRELMVRHGDGDKDIWFTEVGWSSHGEDGPEVAPWDRGVSRERQAEYLAQTLHLVADRYDYVAHVFWYRERDLRTGDAQYDGYGLLDLQLRPKPAWDRLRDELRRDG